ncbi:SAM-dependent methyltransferase [Streptomyces sp. NBC_01092]|uniref:SAM-dependent methyltransferase n=1 Tax=Streptomyces sp. NBC_01092 TaxID=2903748 RepID=UPI003863FCE6|nr:methyltransferase domain-containing protein [Streptomyces sp. NBC_01092]
MTQVSLDHYQRLASADDTVRGDNYRELVTSYYELVTDLYLTGWGESHHFAPLTSGGSLADAVVARQMFLADRAGLAPGMTVLDVGSGVGGPALNIAERTGAHVTGLDLSSKRIGHARELTRQRGLLDRAEFVEGDAMDMPFADGTFDVAYAFEAICHSADKDRVHAEVARVLKPGGMSIGYEWLAADGLSTEDVHRLIDPICRYHAMPHLSTPGQLTEQLRGAGFTDIEVGDPEAAGNLTATWDYLDQMADVGETPDAPPLLRFMCEGARALTRGAREGAFVIEFWQARKPESAAD